MQTKRKFLESIVERRKASAAFSASLANLGLTEEEARRAVLVRQLEDVAETAKKVADTSDNLKATYIKAFKDTAKSIIEASKELGALTANEEVRSATMPASARRWPSLRLRLPPLSRASSRGDCRV